MRFRKACTNGLRPARCPPAGLSGRAQGGNRSVHRARRSLRRRRRRPALPLPVRCMRRRGARFRRRRTVPDRSPCRPTRPSRHVLPIAAALPRRSSRSSTIWKAIPSATPYCAAAFIWAGLPPPAIVPSSAAAASSAPVFFSSCSRRTSPSAALPVWSRSICCPPHIPSAPA